VTTSDPELLRLLVIELERHALSLEGTPTPEETRRAIHAMKGAAGLAGEAELAGALQRLERRHARGDASARAEAASLVRRATSRLREGKAALESPWPVPPMDLEPGEVPSDIRAEYMLSMKERLEQLDLSLRDDDTAAAAESIYRHLHTMKGAASAVGDEVTTWFCHGLEGRMKQAIGGERSLEEGLAEVGRHRATLSALLDDPRGTLDVLKSRGTRPEPRPRGTTRPAEDDRDADTIRIDRSSVDTLLDGFSVVGAVRDGIGARATADARQARELRRLRGDLADALRLIGPPRPWGAPAAALRRIERVAVGLARAADDLERRGADGREADVDLRDLTQAARKELLSMRQTPVRDLFAKVAAVITSEARRAGRDVQVVQQGADEMVDRKLVERLLDPCLHLARNAIAHGIEPAEAREALGKPAVATVTLSARRAASRLTVAVGDDGAGVDVAALRERALASRAISPQLAEVADDDTLLALLFLPGFSTKDNADVLAGRGIGLDIALSSVERLGGSLRVESRRGFGFEARIDVPVESGLESVLWVTAQGITHAIPSAHVLSVRQASEKRGVRAPHLGACLEPGPSEPYAFVAELEAGGAEPMPFFVGVDAVSGPHEVLVRPVGGVVVAMGPYAGAVVLGDGATHLVLDVVALAPRVRALGRVADGLQKSDPPRRSSPP
jgi:two-component system chemotaxis sensor kinase CheA